MTGETPLPAGFEEIDTAVYDNPFQPGTEGHLPFVLVNFTEGLDKGFLGQVLGIGLILDKPHSHAEHALGIFPVEGHLRPAVAIPALFDQVVCQ